MSPRFRPREEPGLFDDLPLHPTPPHREAPLEADKARRDPAPEPPPAPPSESLPLFSENAGSDPADTATRRARHPVVPFRAYLAAGLVDLGIVLGVMLAIWAGLWWLGVDVDLVGRALALVFLLPFSFLYQIFPLAFWGCTPGMARVGIVARSHDGQALSFSQSALRWVASVLTLAAVGLPLILIATTGRSLADRLSGSQTLPAK